MEDIKNERTSGQTALCMRANTRPGLVDILQQHKLGLRDIQRQRGQFKSAFNVVQSIHFPNKIRIMTSDSTD